MTAFTNTDGIRVTLDLISAINEKKQYLSDLDGLIGDGDHGINMNKGFSQAGERLAGNASTLTDSFHLLGTILVEEIGGAMGPLYGSFFRAMARVSRGREEIDAKLFSEMLHAALAKVCDLGGAAVGDKTMLDALVPAIAAFDTGIGGGRDFAAALTLMTDAATIGRDFTRDLIAKKGRASRLGERSKGVLDVGATSCCLILTTMAESIKRLLK
jgi:dihydroxyacetone kinase-like protein